MTNIEAYARQQTGDRIDRVEISRAVAKAIAFKKVGKNPEAHEWARRLVALLECSEILRPEMRLAP